MACPFKATDVTDDKRGRERWDWGGLHHVCGCRIVIRCIPMSTRARCHLTELDRVRRQDHDTARWSQTRNTHGSDSKTTLASPFVREALKERNMHEEE